MQNDTANKNSGNVLVAPISHSFCTSPVVIPIVAQTDSNGITILDGNVLIGNMSCVSKARLDKYISKLSKQEMDAVDQAIIVQTGLLNKFNVLNNIIADKDKYIEKLKNNS
ncbi:MAG: type II toxin-antitoxin system PemK/MazF family toxin [Peptococcaceae bacterium]|nr:type II toxin-antitoxin system PemK/MazF family toxin [Peptococcaceae bacterium]